MKRYLLPLAIVLVPLTVTVLWAWTPRTVPSERVSDLYRRYADNPHLTVAFVEDFPLNDTLTVDVTTLTATDDEGWDSLCVDFNTPVLPVSYLELFEGKDDLVISYKASSDFTEFLQDIGVSEMNAISISYFNHQVVIFGTKTNEQQHAVLHYNLENQLN